MLLGLMDFYLPYILLAFVAVAFFLGSYNKKMSVLRVKGIKFGAPILARYSRDLVALAKEGKLDPVIGREAEIRRLIRILSRRTKNNAILIGEPGVGKTAIAEGLAAVISQGQVPEVLKNKKVLALNLGGLLAGTKYRGEFEQRIEAVTQEILSAQRLIILFIDEIQSISRAGEATGAIGAANLLKPLLARGDLQTIGAATPNDYFKYIQNDSSLERRFQPIIINPPTLKESVKIIQGLRKKYEEYHRVKISDEIIKLAVALTEQYLTDRYFPDKAIDLIDETAAKINLSKTSNEDKILSGEWPQITTKDLEEVLFEWSRDVTKLKETQKIIEKIV